MVVQVQFVVYFDGIIIDVMDIFYNMFVCCKFLCIEKIEYQYIEEVIKCIVFSCLDVMFVLCYNGKVIKCFVGLNDLVVRVGQVCG